MNKMWNYIKDWFIEMGSPPLFFKWSSKILPWLMLVTFVVFILGLAWGLFTRLLITNKEMSIELFIYMCLLQY